MKYKVYKLVNSKNEIEYIGETMNPEDRYNVHKSTQGKFYKRNDIEMIIIKSFNSKKQAFNYQCKLQIQYGFKTDIETLTQNAKQGSIKRIQNLKNGIPHKRAIICFNYKTGEYITEFESIRQAERDLNVDNIEKVLNKKYKQCGGYYFEYK
jgi:predicted GIY-YIG superfamily endonuclease